MNKAPTKYAITTANITKTYFMNPLFVRSTDIIVTKHIMVIILIYSILFVLLAVSAFLFNRVIVDLIVSIVLAITDKERIDYQDSELNKPPSYGQEK